MDTRGTCPALGEEDSSEEFESPTNVSSEKARLAEISDSEIPPGALDNEGLEERARIFKQDEDNVEEEGDHSMAKFFEGMEHPTALAIRKDVIGRDCPKKLLQGICHSLEFCQISSSSKDANLLENQNQPLPQEDVKKPFLTFWPFQADKIEECLDSTRDSALEPVKQKIADLHFDYHELQTGIRLQLEMEANDYLWGKLFDDRDGLVLEAKRKPKREGKFRLQLKQKKIVNMITKEFQEIYGPMQTDHPTVQAYVREYFQWMKEKRAELLSRLQFLREIKSLYGEENVKSHLLYQRLWLQDIQDWLKEKWAQKKITYDLNPFTNVAHLDWFLVPRPNVDESCIFMNHPSLGDALVEYQPIQSSITIPGFWPSLLDLRAIKGVLMAENFFYDIDFPYSVIESDLSEEARQTLKVEEGYWDILLGHMIKEIALYPLGILPETFLRKVKKNIRLAKGYPLFGEVSEEEALSLMTDVWVMRKLPLRRADEKDDAKKAYRTLLFPAYLQGILPNDIRKIMLTVMRRIIFLVESGPGKMLDSRLVEVMYWKHFDVRVKLRNWGFNSVENFIDWCNEQWGGEVGRVEVSGIVGRKGEHYLIVC